LTAASLFLVDEKAEQELQQTEQRLWRAEGETVRLPVELVAADRAARQSPWESCLIWSRRQLRIRSTNGALD
jgi:hypothetical protein